MKFVTCEKIMLGIFTVAVLSGCWAAAAGVGAEAGYVASQEERTTGQVIDDQAIVTSVKTKFISDADVSALDINVDSFKGIVTLKGVVETAHERDEAIRLAYSVNGVKEVQSKLHIE